MSSRNARAEGAIGTSKFICRLNRVVEFKEIRNCNDFILIYLTRHNLITGKYGYAHPNKDTGRESVSGFFIHRELEDGVIGDLTA